MSTRLAVTLSLLALLALPTRTLAQDRVPATVTSVVDGDTIKVQLDGGQTADQFWREQHRCIIDDSEDSRKLRC